MTTDKQIEHIDELAKTLYLNYDMPIPFAKSVAEFLYEEGYRELRQGKWLDLDPIKWECSICHYKVERWNNTPYCPSCGAKMEEK